MLVLNEPEPFASDLDHIAMGCVSSTAQIPIDSRQQDIHQQAVQVKTPHLTTLFIHMVVDLKVLDRIVDDDGPEHIKISFGESFFSSWRK